MLEFQYSSVIYIVSYILLSRSLFVCDGFSLVKTGENIIEDQKTRISKETRVKSYMDETVDPCTDFYKFACGKWPEVYPAKGSETNVLNIMKEERDAMIRRLLKTDIQPSDSEMDAKIKDFHASCITYANEIADGRVDYQQKLRDIIAEVGEMPALYGDAWQAEKFDWLETVASLDRNYYTTALIELTIMSDIADKTKNRIYVTQPSLHLQSKSIYIDEEFAPERQAYKDGIASKLEEYLGLQRNLAQRTANEIVEFETSLARELVDKEMMNNWEEFANRTTAREMSEKYAPMLNIEKLINLTFGEGFPLNEPIYELIESYHQNLVKVLENTPKYIVANYIFYQLIDEFVLNVANREVDVGAICLEKTKKTFSAQLDNMLYRQSDLESSRTAQDIHDLWYELKKTFANEVQSKRLEWISKDTRDKILEKLTAMKFEINTFEGQNCTEVFKGLKVDRNDFLGNTKNILKMLSEKYLEELKGVPQAICDNILLSFTPLHVHEENTVKLPFIQLLSNLIWDPSDPTAVKYGALGTILAHELLHGFDDLGRCYDKEGNSIDWWDEASAIIFDERKMCFVDQYSNYTYGGRLLPRNLFQMENIADNGGIRISYTLYQRWLKEAAKKGMDLSTETFPSMNYTNNQLFFISFAQVSCSGMDTSLFYDKGIYNHAPDIYRVIGTLSNFPEFAQEFSCDAGSPMNPIKKCEIY